MAGPQQVKETGTEAAMKGTHSAAQHSTEVLHQRKNMPYCPVRMAMAGFAFALTLGYFTLYSKKKPEASALDVAKVATGMSSPENTKPHN